MQGASADNPNTPDHWTRQDVFQVLKSPNTLIGKFEQQDAQEAKNEAEKGAHKSIQDQIGTGGF